MAHRDRPTSLVASNPPNSAKEIWYRDFHKRPWGCYVAKIHDPSKKTCVWLGTFDTVEEAAPAYDVVAREFHGAKAKTNFPSSFELPNNFRMLTSGGALRFPVIPVAPPIMFFDVFARVDSVMAAAGCREMCGFDRPVAEFRLSVSDGGAHSDSYSSSIVDYECVSISVPK